ncbi:MAG: dihydrofolate reductase [Afipia sp.]|nr:dihydrofolate reductase [Afipia sp.]
MTQSRLRIEGYVILSANGMLADANHVMPAALKFDADQTFFETALDRADLIVHGRHSFEDQPRSPLRTRIVLTRTIPALARDPANPKATLWNPAGASFEDACRLAGVTAGTASIIGGPNVFEMFMDRYDVFWLSQAHRLTIPDGTGGFPGIPAQSAQDILAAHGLTPAETRMLDAAQAVDVTAWRRAG